MPNKPNFKAPYSLSQPPTTPKTLRPIPLLLTLSPTLHPLLIVTTNAFSRWLFLSLAANNLRQTETISNKSTGRNKETNWRYSLIWRGQKTSRLGILKSTSGYKNKNSAKSSSSYFRNKKSAKKSSSSGLNRSACRGNRIKRKKESYRSRLKGLLRTSERQLTLRPTSSGPNPSISAPKRTTKSC